jgi:hypothetical protein
VVLKQTVNIFLAVYIPDLNISSHVKLTFLHCSLQCPCRLQLPKNRVELALGVAPSLKTGTDQNRQPEAENLAAVQLCLAEDLLQ